MTNKIFKQCAMCLALCSLVTLASAATCIDKRDVRIAFEAANAELKVVDEKGMRDRDEALVVMGADLEFSSAQAESYKLGLEESPLLAQFQTKRAESSQALFNLLKQKGCEQIPAAIEARREAVRAYWNATLMVVAESWKKGRMLAQVMSSFSARQSSSMGAPRPVEEILPLGVVTAQFRYDADNWTLGAAQEKVKDIQKWSFSHSKYPLLGSLTLMKFGVVDSNILGIFLKAGVESSGPHFKIVVEPKGGPNSIQEIAYTETDKATNKSFYTHIKYYADEQLAIEVSCQSYLHLYAQYESACRDFFSGLKVTPKDKKQ